ncbi:hypothetical protein EJB05_46936, partial [Eragrostis curvula]
MDSERARKGLELIDEQGRTDADARTADEQSEKKISTSYAAASMCSSTMEIGSVAALPDDAVADVLRRLPFQSLAVARCVCKSWRDVVDARALLRAHLLPHWVHGVFINYIDHERPHLFAAPSSTSSIPSSTVDNMLSFMPTNDDDEPWSVLDHCNGLLLCSINSGRNLCVCNPATRQWTLLPQCKGASSFGFDPYAFNTNYRCYAGAYLAFDPAISPHYRVFLIPHMPKKENREKLRQQPREDREKLRQQELDKPFCLDWFFSASEDGTLLASEETEVLFVEENNDDPTSVLATEWPPASWSLNVFSSETAQWEERVFCREGDPAGTLGSVRNDPSRPIWWWPRQRYAAYWRGALYVHCRGAFVTRLPMSGNKYQVVKTPTNANIGRSKMGMYFGEVCQGQLSVWVLNESCGQVEWVLKYQHDLRKQAQYMRSFYRDCKQMDGPWTVVEDNVGMHESDDSGTETTSGEEDSESYCDSDDDVTSTDCFGEEYVGTFVILGFHPYEEVVFLIEPFGTAAYHLNDTQIEYLGNSRPKSYEESQFNGVYESFVYTPCMIGASLSQT